MGKVWASRMAGFDLSDYFDMVGGGDSVASLNALQALYEAADASLASLARDDGENVSDIPDLEAKLLDHKAHLIVLATKIRCNSTEGVRAKVAFLKAAYLDGKREVNFSETDDLILSIWQDFFQHH